MAQKKSPATAIQLGAALAALGAWGGANTAAEHAAERERLGRSEEFYRMCLVNSLLGIVETEVMRCETAERPEDGLTIACQQALEAAGATQSDAVLLEFLRWRTPPGRLDAAADGPGTRKRGVAARRRTCR